MIRDFNFDLQRFDSAFSGGRGTESDPYRISTLTDLEQLRRDVNSGTSYDGKFLKVTNDIALSDNWAAIGGIDNRFRGTFDGDGHSISDFRVYHTNHDLCEGLFGYIEGATIKNVNLTNVNIRSDYYTIGPITAYASNSQVINCSVQGNMEVGGIGVHVGGLFGDFYGNSIKNCAFLGTFKIIDQANEVGIIAGISPSLNGESYYYGDYDNLNPNGAVRIYNATVPKGVTSSGIVSYVGKDYVKKGDVTFDYLGGTYKYNVTGDVSITLKDNKFFVNDTDLGALFPTTLDGDGSGNNPYLIKTANQLSYLAGYVNSGNDCAGLNFRLANDIALSGEWSPIGAGNNKFSGTFDGNNRTISGLTISSRGKTEQGLFGTVKDATIRNVNLTDVNITAKDSVGALVGEAEGNTRISNCSAQGSVEATGTMRPSVGGLVGEIKNGVAVQGSTFSGNVAGFVDSRVGSSSGGLVGNNIGGAVMNSAFLGGSIEGTNRGVIVGKDTGTSIDNYYHGNLIGNMSGINANGAQQVFRVTAPNNVTSNALIQINGRRYIKGGEQTFTYNGDSYNYTITGDIAVTVQGSTLNFNNTGTTENYLSTLQGKGSESNPYLIKTEENLRQLATYVNSGNNCAGVNFKLANDIALSSNWTPIGDNIRTFKGAFDGDGHTVSNLVISDTAGDGQGLFGYTDDATIKNLNITGVNVTGRDKVGALVGNATGNTQIVNSSAQGNVTASGTGGGLVGTNSGTIKDSVYFGGTINGASKGAITGTNSGTLTGNYYRGTLASGVNDNGAQQIFNVTVPNDVTSSALVTYNGTKYIKSGQTIFDRNGKKYSYNVTGDSNITLQDNKLLVNNTAAEILFPGSLEGEGTATDPYLVKTAENLRQLATYVNSGNDCAGLNFKLANNIALAGEWTPIGAGNNKFSGTFDGGGHTVSGLTIKDSSTKDLQGLFGTVEAATIKNVTLSNVDVIGHFRAGALVGDARGNAQIVNCSANGNVTSNKLSSFIGGLIGRITGDVVVDGCSFSGNVSGLSLKSFPLFGSHIGGVVGFYDNGTIRNSAYLGGTLTSSHSSAIASMTRESGTLIDNYYRGTLAEGVDNNGATRIYNVTLPRDVTSSALVTFNGTNYIKAGATTFTYGGNNYKYNVTGDVAVTLRDNKLFVGGQELQSSPQVTVTTSENRTLRSSADLATFSATTKSTNDAAQGKTLYAGDNGSTLEGGAGDDTLWGGAGSDTFIHNGGHDIIFGFGKGDLLKINGFDDIIATYNAADNNIKIPCGTGSVTLKDFTTNEFPINSDTWTLSGNTISKNK